MAILQHKHSGLVLAAGASSRMGQPKALLKIPSGKLLAMEQAGALMAAGITDVVVVLGHNAEEIVAALGETTLRYCFNSSWATGRLSSLQSGLRALPTSIYGVLILPVDTVGVKPATLSRIISMADETTAVAIRPAWQKKPGRILWLSRAVFEEILAIDPDPSFRLDAWMEPRETRLEVDDPAILNNINTPDEWRRVMID
jgi:molybdenum cofactor cytidylyltransferase